MGITPDDFLQIVRAQTLMIMTAPLSELDLIMLTPTAASRRRRRWRCLRRRSTGCSDPGRAQEVEGHGRPARSSRSPRGPRCC